MYPSNVVRPDRQRQTTEEAAWRIQGEEEGQVQRTNVEAIVAGHICLDVIPAFRERESGIDTLLVPGKLIEVGPAVMATGGAVSNTGLALHRLGWATALMGKVGDDLFGRAILDILRRQESSLADGMIVTPGEPTSYTLVINPPGIDRMFLHCPGTNDTFSVDDVPEEALSHARLFHFGYPPIMRRMYADGGRELEALFRRAKAHGLTTTLDMAMPDPESDAARVDWRALLERTLPSVDVFLPSLDEILFMLDPERFDALRRAGEYDAASLLQDLSAQLLGMGVAVVALKLGDQGLYLRTTADPGRLASMGRAAPPDPRRWAGRELLSPCFRVSVAGTTGAGDCTIAGFLAGLLQGSMPEDTMTGAVAVGACSVEQADATSGVPSWPAVERRIRAGWPRLPVTLGLPGWRWASEQAIYVGPNDSTRAEELKNGER